MGSIEFRALATGLLALLCAGAVFVAAIVDADVEAGVAPPRSAVTAR